jgi:hypothetical protein
VGALEDGLDVEQVIFALFAHNVHAAFASALAQARNESREAMP